VLTTRRSPLEHYLSTELATLGGLFGRLLADYAWNLINLYSVSVTSLAAQVNVYGLRNDYALHVASCDGVDTAEVWGSSPHAPLSFRAPERFSRRFGILRMAKRLCESAIGTYR